MAARSSLLFSPVAEDARRPKYAEVAAASSLFSANESGSSIEESNSPIKPSSFPASVSVADSSTASTSTNRKPSQPDSNGLPLGSGMNATTGHLPLSSNAYNILPGSNYTASSNAPPVPPRLSHFPNASHPAIIGMPIPATRFDTVTSYVDVIYQQQQQQKEQNGSKSTSNPSTDPLSEESEENGVVLLCPSDGIDGDDSFMATCPKCAMMVMTEFEHFPGQKSYRMACLFTPLLMCWAPLYWDSFGRKWKDVKHWCPRCRSLIAIYRK